MDRRTLLDHVALQCNDKEKAEIFFTEILELPMKKKCDIPAGLSKTIFGIEENVEVEVYDNDKTRFEVFITPLVEKHDYEHICIEVNSKKEFIERCEKYDIKPIIIQRDNKNLLFVKDFSGNLFEVKEKSNL